MYGEILEDYVDMLAGRYRKGTIGREQFIKLTDKLAEWETIAIERGLL